MLCHALCTHCLALNAVPYSCSETHTCPHLLLSLACCACFAVKLIPCYISCMHCPAVHPLPSSLHSRGCCARFDEPPELIALLCMPCHIRLLCYACCAFQTVLTAPQKTSLSFACFVLGCACFAQHTLHIQVRAKCVFDIRGPEVHPSTMYSQTEFENAMRFHHALPAVQSKLSSNGVRASSVKLLSAAAAEKMSTSSCNNGAINGICIGTILLCCC